jgi:hypothetical protein
MGIPTRPRDSSTIKKLVPDDRGRITIGKPASAVSSYQATFNADGSILLVPMAEIPAREMWLWTNKAALESVQRGLHQARRGKTKPLDLSELGGDDD